MTAPAPVGELPPGTDPPALHALAVELAQAGGAVLRRHRRPAGGVDVTATKSSATDVVTAADLAAEDELRRLLAAARPSDGVRGEEGGMSPGSSGLTWVLDPLDGTVNYLYDIDSYAVSVAVVAGEPRPQRWVEVAGAVHDAARQRTYSAHRGGGARRDGSPLRPSDCSELARCLLGTGFGYAVADRRVHAAAIARLLPQVRDIRRLGSAALDLCAVAAGSLDGYVEQGLQPYDHAAGVLVAREAGAVVGGVAGGPVDSRLCVAATPGIAAPLAAAAEAAGYLDNPQARPSAGTQGHRQPPSGT